MSINFKAIGQRIKEYRNSQKLLQEELAWKAQLSIPYLSSIENGKKEASLQALNRIAKALHVQMINLLIDEVSFGKTNEFQRLSIVLNDCDETEHHIIMDVIISSATALKCSLREHKNQ
jgi:Predicted transcriptional regulator with C-terminal CBS domains